MGQLLDNLVHHLCEEEVRVELVPVCVCNIALELEDLVALLDDVAGLVRRVDVVLHKLDEFCHLSLALTKETLNRLRSEVAV